MEDAITMMRRPFRTLVKDGNRNTSGSVAIEFALIAPIFLLLLFAIIETSLAWFGGMVLENGMKQTARLIRTGQAQNTAMTQNQFRDALCAYISVVLSCAPDRLYIDVRSYSNFAASAYPNPIAADGTMDPTMNSYNIGSSSQGGGGNTIVLARAFYAWPMFTPLLGQFYANMANNTHLLSSSVAFRNEPF